MLAAICCERQPLALHAQTDPIPQSCSLLQSTGVVPPSGAINAHPPVGLNVLSSLGRQLYECLHDAGVADAGDRRRYRPASGLAMLVS